MTVRLRDVNLTTKTWVHATLGETTIHGMLTGRSKSEIGAAWMIDVPGQRYRSGYDGIYLWDDEPWMVTVTQPPITLPTEPGTVIAIGDWWLVRLRRYETAESSAWELLPMPTKQLSDRVKSMGIATQCVYGDSWVQAEAEQEGGFVVVSKPRDAAP